MEATKAIPIIQQEQLFENVSDETIVLKGSKVEEPIRAEAAELDKKKNGVTSGLKF